MQGTACLASLCPLGLLRLQRCLHIQQAQALVDVVWSQQPEFVQANEVHCKDAPQLHAPQDVVPIVEGKCLACCRYLPLYISLFSPYMDSQRRTMDSLDNVRADFRSVRHEAVYAKGFWAHLPVCVDGVGPQVAVPVKHEDLVGRCDVCPGSQLSPAPILQDTLMLKPTKVITLYIQWTVCQAKAKSTGRLAAYFQLVNAFMCNSFAVGFALGSAWSQARP